MTRVSTSLFLSLTKHAKTFDKVWHQGLRYKLEQNGISGISDFLDNRNQRVILNGQYCSWAKAEAGVPQGSFLGPLLFLIYINDLSQNLASNPKLIADDTSLFSVVKSADASNIDLNNYLKIQMNGHCNEKQTSILI